jgi:hypothetical protein
MDSMAQMFAQMMQSQQQQIEAQQKQMQESPVLMQVHNSYCNPLFLNLCK